MRGILFAMEGMKNFVNKVEEHFGPERKFLKTSVGIFLLGTFLGELAPDPTDAIHFWLQKLWEWAILARGRF